MVLFSSLGKYLGEMAEHRRDMLLLVLVGLLLFLPGLTSRDLWNPDEPRYAEVTREMLTTGDFLVPHLNGETYAHKPPLLFWLMAVSATVLGGMTPAAAHLPSTLAAVAAMVLVYLIGRELFDRRVGLMAAAIFATSTRILWQGRVGQIDMLLVALVAAAVLIWARGRSRGDERLSLWFYVVAGVATLAKGPVGLIIPVLAIVGYCAVRRDWAGLRGLRLGTGLAVWAAVVLAWVVPAGISGGEAYFRELVFKQNVTRYAAAWHHHRPWYYLLTSVPGDFFPWSFLLPGAVVVALREREERQRSPVVFALAWVITTMVFFSLSPGKRTVYVLPMYPALALLVAAGMDRLRASWPRHRAVVVWPLAAVALLLGAVAALLAGLPQLVAARPDLGAELHKVAVLGEDFPNLVLLHVLILVVASATALGLMLSGRPRGTVAALAAGMAVFAVSGSLLLMPRMDVVKSARPLALELLELNSGGAPIGIYDEIDPRFIFHTRTFVERLHTRDEAQAFLDRPEQVWFLIERDDLEHAEPPLEGLREVARDADPFDGYLLCTNRPENGSAQEIPDGGGDG